jgi:CDP-diacylglycerol--glycerol-3-phosphate 3-phosphatidyltransferase
MLPNIITVTRILLTPLILFLLFVPSFVARFTAFILFLIAAISDLWDGHLARKHGWVTDFGKVFDPIADKLLLVTMLVAFYILTRPARSLTLPVIGGFPMWLLLVIFGREFLITAIRWLAARRGVVIASGKAGKFKAWFQNIFIGASARWPSTAVESRWCYGRACSTEPDKPLILGRSSVRRASAAARWALIWPMRLATSRWPCTTAAPTSPSGVTTNT